MKSLSDEDWARYTELSTRYRNRERLSKEDFDWWRAKKRYLMIRLRIGQRVSQRTHVTRDLALGNGWTRK